MANIHTLNKPLMNKTTNDEKTPKPLAIITSTIYNLKVNGKDSRCIIQLTMILSALQSVKVYNTSDAYKYLTVETEYAHELGSLKFDVLKTDESKAFIIELMNRCYGDNVKMGGAILTMTVCPPQEQMDLAKYQQKQKEDWKKSMEAVNKSMDTIKKEVDEILNNNDKKDDDDDDDNNITID